MSKTLNRYITFIRTTTNRGYSHNTNGSKNQVRNNVTHLSGREIEEIQAWVQEKYGFHVTHLNIAKTKRKCGIIERQNYNLPKNKNSRSPETPMEKEEAIIEAFKAFQMI